MELTLKRAILMTERKNNAITAQEMLVRQTRVGDFFWYMANALVQHLNVFGVI